MRSWIIVLLVSSCANPITKAVKDVKYSAYEKIGLEKRDLFKRELGNVQEDQNKTQEAFKDALTQLKEVYGFDGGDLEDEYDDLKSCYDDAREESKDVSQSIARLDSVAQDLFTEWEGEIDDMKDSSLRQRSSAQLRATQKKYQALASKLKKTETKIEPVLSKLNDQVLFLKHNLNSRAVEGLKSEGRKIEGDIARLIRDMESASKDADAIIKTL